MFMESTNLPKYSIRELSRETKKVLANLPCLITYDKRIIAKIEAYDLQDSEKLQSVQPSESEGDRGQVSADDKDGELPSLC